MAMTAQDERFIHMQRTFYGTSQGASFLCRLHYAYMQTSYSLGGWIGEDEDDRDRYRAPALDKGLDILELLAGVDGGLTQAEIAKRLQRSPNEFYRMLDRLVRRGYVTRLDGDRYSLTLETVRPCAIARTCAPAWCPTPRR